MTKEVVELAQNVARNCGYAVFPCLWEKKNPATPHGFLDATRDPEAVSDLWRRHPGQLIGVATGEASGISVLDVDIKSDAARAWWRENEPQLPATRTYRTRSGGGHLVFQHTPGVKNSNGKPTPGIDSRGDGGYVIWWFAAGFECLDHTPPAPWPAWLSTYFWPPQPKPAERRSATVLTSGAALNGLLGTVRDAQDGTRNSVLFWGACRMRERIAAGLIAQGDARHLLIEAATTAGLPAIEVERAIASAWRSA